jgi:uncharacterized protein YrrD
MDSNASTRKWTEIRGLAVVALGTGLKVGTVEDFYFEPESNSVRGLRVKTGLFGNKALPSNAISSIGRDAIITANEEMVIDESHDGRLPELPLGHNLLSYKVISESGSVVGTVGNIFLNTEPPVALRVTRFELAGNLGERITRHYQTFSAQEVIRYGQDVIVILDQAARQLS